VGRVGVGAGGPGDVGERLVLGGGVHRPTIPFQRRQALFDESLDEEGGGGGAEDPPPLSPLDSLVEDDAEGFRQLLALAPDEPEEPESGGETGSNEELDPEGEAEPCQRPWPRPPPPRA
jgi:hypothetical protein